ncbi:unnamed protein product, partial [Ectocarpus sp. 12 AP-2014]
GCSQPLPPAPPQPRRQRRRRTGRPQEALLHSPVAATRSSHSASGEAKFPSTWRPSLCQEQHLLARISHRTRVISSRFPHRYRYWRRPLFLQTTRPSKTSHRLRERRCLSTRPRKHRRDPPKRRGPKTRRPFRSSPAPYSDPKRTGPGTCPPRTTQTHTPTTCSP